MVFVSIVQGVVFLFWPFTISVVISRDVIPSSFLNSLLSLIIWSCSCSLTFCSSSLLFDFSSRWFPSAIVLVMQVSWTEVKPLPPSFLGTYSRSTSLRLWRLPVYVRILLVAISRFLISCLVQFIIPIVGVITGMAKVLWAVILLLLYRSELYIFLTRLLYSFVTLSLLRGPL